MSIDINTVLNNISQNYNNAAKNANSITTNNTNINTESIFAKASELVSAFKEEQNNKQSSKSSNGIMGGLNYAQVANMSTKEFLNYAYNNKTNSGYKEASSDSSGVDLPLLVSYKGQLVTTAGKSFMQVVAKLSAKFPRKSEEEIAAELMTKYGKFDEKGDLITNSGIDQTTTNTQKLNLSA